MGPSSSGRDREACPSPGLLGIKCGCLQNWVLYFDRRDTSGSFYKDAKAAQTSLAQMASRIGSLEKQRGRPLRGEEFVVTPLPLCGTFIG